MPYIATKTTKKISPEKREAVKAKLGCAIELIRGKSERWLMLSFEDSLNMYFAGTDDDCALLEVELFGSASDAEYDALTARLTEIFEEELEIPARRIYVKYTEIEHWGFAGENF